MRKAKRKLVEWQETTERDGGAHSYEAYVAKFEDSREDTKANPDSLPEQSHAPSTPQLIMGEAVEHLQGRQKAVYLMLMREDMSMEDVAEAMNIGKSTVQVFQQRAIEFITAYCKEAMNKGRI